MPLDDDRPRDKRDDGDPSETQRLLALVLSDVGFRADLLALVRKHLARLGERLPEGRPRQ